MPQITGKAQAPFLDLVNAYDRAFRERDIIALRGLYSSDSRVRFFDNDPSCDSPDLDDHMAKLASFFESGTVVPISTESPEIFATDSAACITVIHRYSNRPFPAVRATYYAELESGSWRIRHIHCSYDPSEAAE